jgi:hypothetical protein
MLSLEVVKGLIDEADDHGQDDPTTVVETIVRFALTGFEIFEVGK